MLVAENLVAKILAEHMRGGSLEPGEEVSLRIDQTLLQDATGTMASLQFEKMGVDRARVPFAVQYVDHNIIQLDFKNPDDHRFLQAFAAKYGVYYSRPGNGICHYCTSNASPNPARPSSGPTRTPPLRRFGLHRHRGRRARRRARHGRPALRIEVPKVVGVELTGKLPEWVTPKDVIWSC
jgi:aconitate hydratase